MVGQISTRPIGWSILTLSTAVVLLFAPQPVQAQATLDPCAVRASYDQAKAAAEAADEAFKKLEEPDWSKLPKGYEQYFDPAGQDPLSAVSRGQKIEALLKKLKGDLQKQKEVVGNLTLKQAQSNVDAAKAQEKAVKQAYDQKLTAISKLDGALVNIIQDIKAIEQNPDMPTNERRQTIATYQETIKEKEAEVRALVGHQEMEAVRFRVANSAFKDFVTEKIAEARRALSLAESVGIADEIATAKANLNLAVEDARQQARAALDARDQIAKDLQQFKPAIDLLNAIDQKEQKLEQTKKERENLEKQKPIFKDLDNAYIKRIETEEKLEAFQRASKAIPTLEATLASIEPWFKAWQKSDSAFTKLEQAKLDYANAIEAKNKLLDREKARFNLEQTRINQTRSGLQGQVKDPLYYQKLSQMTLHARATYELILLNLVDLDCFGDVRSFMDDLKQRMKRLDQAREQILKEASAAAKAAVAKPVAVRGTFGRTSLVVGKAGGPAENNNAKFYGSVSATSFSWTTEMKLPYVGKANVQHSWNTPPSTLKPGDIIELGCSSTASKSGVDAPILGSNCMWRVEGRVQLLEPAVSSYTGTASDGKFYPQGKGKVKFRVLPGAKGDTITIIAAHGGPFWQDAAKEIPAIYKYTFNP